MMDYVGRAEALGRHIADDASLHGIVGFPLFMVLACRAYIGGTESGAPLLELPATRVELLERCILTYDQDWEKNKKDRPFGELRSWLERRRAYEKVAWEFARRGQFGSFDYEDLLEQLAETPNASGRQLVDRDPESAIADLPFLVPQSGRGATASWGFTVRILQEHFAARALARQEDPFQVIKPVLHHPAWRNVICLTAGLIEGVSKREAYITSIFQAGSEWEDQIHRDLFLAAECLREAELHPSTPIVSMVVQLLIHKALRVRGVDSPRAGYALGKLGPEMARAAVSALVDALLRDEDGKVRYMVARAVGELGPEMAADAIKSLIAALQDGNRDSRRAAAYALGELGPEMTTAAVGALVDALLRDEDDEVRLAAAYALGELEPEMAAAAVEPLINALEDGDRDAHRAAAIALGQLGPIAGPQAVSALVDALLCDEDDVVGFVAVRALGQLRGIGPQYVDPLVEALQDERRSVRCLAVYLLGWSPQAVGPLVEALGDEDAGVRGVVVRHLGKLAPVVRQAVGPLVNSLWDQDNRVRSAAAEVLGELGPESAPQTARPLISALRDRDGGVRRAAAYALGKLGSEMTPQAVGPLVEALRDDDGNVREGAAIALGQLGPIAGPQAVGPLVEAVRDKDWGVRNWAAGALAELGLCAAQHPSCLAAVAQTERSDALDTLVALLEAEKPPVLPLV